MARTVALLAGLSLFPVVMELTVGASVILDLPSLLIVLVGAFLFTSSAHGASGLLRALGAAFSEDPLSIEDCQQHRRVLESLRNAICATGAAGFLLGLIAILANLADPSAIGPAMAVAMLTTLYAVILAELVVAPLANALPSRIEGSGPPGSDEVPLLTKSRGAAMVFVVLISQATLVLGVAATI